MKLELDRYDAEIDVPEQCIIVKNGVSQSNLCRRAAIGTVLNSAVLCSILRDNGDVTGCPTGNLSQRRAHRNARLTNVSRASSNQLSDQAPSEN